MAAVAELGSLDVNMTDALPPLLEEIYRLIDSDRYEEATRRLAELRSPEADEPIVFLYKALCVYEARDDLECLRLLAEFIKAAPKHHKVPYALYTFAICLQNLGLDPQALNILESLPRSYPDLDVAIADCRKSMEAVATANAIYESLRGRT
jgi:tetratricopeptide (TPR) repeat protein